MTTFTTQDRIDSEITVEPIPFMGLVRLQNKEDVEQMLRDQIRMLNEECQHLRQQLMDHAK